MKELTGRWPVKFYISGRKRRLLKFEKLTPLKEIINGEETSKILQKFDLHYNVELPRGLSFRNDTNFFFFLALTRPFHPGCKDGEDVHHYSIDKMKPQEGSTNRCSPLLDTRVMLQVTDLLVMWLTSDSFVTNLDPLVNNLWPTCGLIVIHL